MNHNIRELAQHWPASMLPCALCSNKDDIKVAAFVVDGAERCISCPRCGVYGASLEYLETYDRHPSVNLSGLARELYERGDTLVVTTENRSQLLKLAPATVPERADRLLLAIGRRAISPGGMIEFNPDTDYPLAYAANAADFDFYFEQFEKRGFLSSHLSTRGKKHCKLSLAGWQALEAIAAKRAFSDKAFVAMCFWEKYDPLFDNAIEVAVTNAGWDPIRVDRVEHTENINDFIVARIRESRFIVADFTENRAGVYFEAGFAYGLGMPVIWTCHKEHIENLHFDTEHFNHIVWTNYDELRVKLERRIRAVVGLGPHCEGVIPPLK